MMAVPPKVLGSMLYYRDNLGTGPEDLPSSIVMALKQLSDLDYERAENGDQRGDKQDESAGAKGRPPRRKD
jgi:hypothetical protein